MKTDYTKHATTQEITERFNNDVERFSNLDTGQLSTIDAPLSMELCTSAAQYLNADATELLDIGCGAGNYTLKMLEKISNLNCTMNDLSAAMLEKAKERVSAQTTGQVKVVESDMRQLQLEDNHYDIILAAAVFHHLREDTDWEHVFSKMYAALKPGGSIWISDLIAHDSPAINSVFQDKYGAYLESIGDKAYREKVFAYIAYEDTPRSLTYQIDLLKKTGFKVVEVLHKNLCFAAFGAIK